MWAVLESEILRPKLRTGGFQGYLELWGDRARAVTTFPTCIKITKNRFLKKPIGLFLFAKKSVLNYRRPATYIYLQKQKNLHIIIILSIKSSFEPVSEPAYSCQTTTFII